MIKNRNIRRQISRTGLVLALMVLTATTALAEQVTEEQARQQALDFLTSLRPTNVSRRSTGGTPQFTATCQVSGLYVFNVTDGGGFVVVSNDDRTIPVLGYGDTGSIDPDDMPANMRAWLQGYADEIAWLQQNNITVAAARTSAPRRADGHSTAPICPLVTTTWNQGTPYNDLCPEYASGKRSVTGCVATAMAQVMNYHKWPKKDEDHGKDGKTHDIPGYTTSSYSIDLTAGLPATTFDWGNMINSYSGNYTLDQAKAVATLMQYCGYSVQMDYGPSSGASTIDVANALKNYFDYNTTTTRFVTRSYYTAAKWADLIYYELANRRPVVYGGQSSGGGHEFVCDGYKYLDETDFFHINWGWGGQSDYYFVLSALDPDAQGIGGSSSTDGFHYGQEAVIGIQPSTRTDTMSGITPNTVNLTLNSMTPSSNLSIVGESVNITLNIINNSSDVYDGDIFLGRKVGDYYELLEGNNFLIAAGETIDIVIPFTPTAAGTYDLVLFLPNGAGSYTTDGVVRASLISAITNKYIPVYGYYCNNSTIQSQFIIPASDLQEMLYAALDGVTFYANTTSAISWGEAEFDVYLQEVAETTFESGTLKDWSTMEKVYSGSLSVGNDGKMVITFDNSYQYTDGNLLVGINQTKLGAENSVYWIGKSAKGVSLGGYNGAINQRNFLPMTTFVYTPGELPAVMKPTNVTVNYTGGTTAEVTWTSTESVFDIDINGTVTENVSSPYTLTNLDLATVYTVKVRAKNGSEYSDWSYPATFNTDLSDETCSITFELTDYYGDGWNAAAIKVVDKLTGTVIGTYTNENLNGIEGNGTNELNTHLVPVPNDRDINFVWINGNYDNECSFVIYDVNGEVIYEFKRNSTGTSAGVFATYHVNCTYAPKPIDLTVTPTPTSAIVTWTGNDAATSYNLRYRTASGFLYIGNSNDDSGWTTVTNVTSPYVLQGLTTETYYEVQLQGVYTEDVSEWTETAFFTTPAANATPTDLVADLLDNGATLSWTGYQDSYNVRYRTAGWRNVYFFDDFESNNTNAWTQNSGIVLTGVPYSGFYFVGLGYSSRDTQYLISPELNNFESGATLEFYQRCYQSETTFKVGFSTTTANVDAFTWGDEQTAASTYTLYRQVIPEGTKYIAIQTTAAEEANALFIDSYGVFGPSTEPGEWQESNDITQTSLTLTELLPGTKYEWQVSGNNVTTEWSDSEYFTTYIILADNVNNGGIIAQFDWKQDVHVKLSGRTLLKNGAWNTLCLPFDMTIAGSVLDGDDVDVRTLISSSFEGGALTLTFTDKGAVTKMEAGKPYIIKWDNTDDNLVSPVFTGVTVKSGTTPAETGYVDFVGTYIPTNIYTAEKTNLYLGAASTLYYPWAEGMTEFNINACRAYFQLKNGLTAGEPTDLNSVRAFTLDFGKGAPTGIRPTPSPSLNGGEWYDLSGRKLDKAPTRKGLYIHNGKVVIK